MQVLPETMRETTEILFSEAQRMGLKPIKINRNLFTVEIAGTREPIYFTVNALNSHIAASLVKNKYLARMLLEKNNFTNIPYIITKDVSKLKLFLLKHGTIIAKPMSGSGAVDIHIVRNFAQTKNLRLGKYIFEKYIAGIELRFLVLESKVIAVHQSSYGTDVSANRALRRISYAQSDWQPELVERSLAIFDVFGLGFGTVDYIQDEHGTSHILEVNTQPGLKWFYSPSEGPAVDVANLYFQALIDAKTQK